MKRRRGRARSRAALRKYNRTATRAMRARAARKGWRTRKARARSRAAKKAAETRARKRAASAAPVTFQGAPVSFGGGGGGAGGGGPVGGVDRDDITDEEYYDDFPEYGFEGDEEVYTGEGV